MGPGYQFHDGNDAYGDVDADADLGDAGDMPLLRRDGSRASGMGGGFRAGGSGMSMPMPVPGAYEDAGESNIRYGRIPQRVPRRYKTIKKVE